MVQRRPRTFAVFTIEFTIFSMESRSLSPSPSSDSGSVVLSGTFIMQPIEDVKSPFETEAEVTILHAIEEAERQRADSASDRDKILQGVPAEKDYLFDDDDDAAPRVFSLMTSNARNDPPDEPLSPTPKPPKMRDVAKRVQIASRFKQGSLASGEASVRRLSESQSRDRTYSRDRVPEQSRDQTYSRDRVPDVVSMNTIEPTMSPPKMTEILQRIKKMESVSHHRRTSSLDPEYAEIPTTVHEDVGCDEEQGFDPESVARNEGALGATYGSENDGMRQSQRQSAISCFRRSCYPCLAFKNFISIRKRSIQRYIKIFLYGMIPIQGISCILFYLAGNPMGPLNASYSWWLMFIIRQMFTFSLSRLTEIFLIDFIALETSLAVVFLGRICTLMAMQAKGWPMLSLLWGLWNFAILHGQDKFR